MNIAFYLYTALIVANTSVIVADIFSTRVTSVEYQRLGVFNIVLSTVLLFMKMYEMLTCNYAFIDVIATSNALIPEIYRLLGIWGSSSGSLLLWIYIHSVVQCLLFYKVDPENRARILYSYRFSVILLLVFILYSFGLSNPFLRSYEFVTVGGEYNPILQDTVMLIHPPILYIGDILSVHLFIILMNLLTCRTNSMYLLTVFKRYYIYSWLFLTVGIALGSWWSYHELGWGGIWFWDPVENISIIPWILICSLIHIRTRQDENRVDRICVLITMLTSLVALTGTFIIRSGLLMSVHSFSNSSIVSVSVIGAITALYIYTYTKTMSVRQHNLLAVPIRHSNMYWYIPVTILLFTACIIFLGTVLPMIAKYLMSTSLSIGTVFYTNLLLPLLFAMVTALIIYYAMTNGILLLLATIVSVTMLICINSHIATYTSTIFLISIIIVIIQLLVNKSMSRSQRIGHLGFMIFLAGVIVSSTYDIEITQVIQPGGLFQLFKYSILFLTVDNIHLNTHTIFSGTFLISVGFEIMNILNAEKQFYSMTDVFLTKSGIISNVFSDIYIMISDGVPLHGWFVRILYSPLISFIWIAALIVVLTCFTILIRTAVRKTCWR